MWENFLSAFPPCRSQGHSVYIRTGQTARHQPQSLAPQRSQPVPPSQHHWLWRMLTKVLQRAAPPGPGAVTSQRKGWGRKDGGDWYFQLLWKIGTGFVGSAGVIQDQPASLFLFRLGGENPPTPALFPHPAPRHSLSGFSLHGKICRISHCSLSLTFWVYGKKKENFKKKKSHFLLLPQLEFIQMKQQRVSLSLSSPESQFSADIKL